MKTLLYILLLVLCPALLKAQWEDKIYGINNASSGVFYFSEIDLETGELTDLNLLDLGFTSSNFSSAYNNILEQYYLCTGTELMKIDIYSGEVIETVELLVDGSYLHIHYDMCDRVLYGIINNYPEEIAFAKFDLTENEFIEVLPIDEYPAFCMGCQSVIDYENRVYYYKSGSEGGRLIGIDLEEIEVISDPLIYDVTNGNFGHIDLWCEDNTIYGTTADINDSAKQLAHINKQEGNSEIVSDASWDVGIWKPAVGGSCIDQDEGIFYYSGAGSLVVGVDIESSEKVEEFFLNSGEFLFMEHFSDCICQEEITNVLEWESESRVFPNPFHETLNFSGVGTKMKNIRIYDLSGRLVYENQFSTNSFQMNLDKITPGIYNLFISDKSGSNLLRKTIVKS